MDEKTDLLDAENQNLVKTAITSKGEHSGECMNLDIKNLKSKAIKIIIPAGTVFIADNPEEQNILVTKDLFCYLKPNESKQVNLEGYCCEAHDSSPDEGSGFKTNKHKDEKVIKLVNYLKDKNYPVHTIQDAVWCVANGSPISNIYLENEEDQKTLRNFISELTGQKDTWYTTPQNHVIGEDRSIRSEPVEVKGMLKYTTDKAMEVNNAVYDSNNSLLFKFERPLKVPGKGTFEYEFKIRVTGWDKGKYYVLVSGDGRQLLKQEFEI